jgi:hypothetical protein
MGFVVDQLLQTHEGALKGRYNLVTKFGSKDVNVSEEYNFNRSFGRGETLEARA